jgi:pantoate--beta-alanine ligase
MGALHRGHQSLFTLAAEKSESVVASIFVNPLQFENPDDLARYPRTPEQDAELAEEAGVTHLWLPLFEDIYPPGFAKLSAGPLGNIYEGASRPGHFDGVVTVVSRLFDLVRPQYAIFGEKDFQQLFLIKEMVAQMKLPIEIISAPTIREASGLAMSSRNQKLSIAERESAAGIYVALNSAKAASDLRSARLELSNGVQAIPNFLLDYAEIIDADTFAVADDSTKNCRAIVAGWINGIRLIDNMAMSNLGDSK